MTGEIQPLPSAQCSPFFSPRRTPLSKGQWVVGLRGSGVTKWVLEANAARCALTLVSKCAFAFSLIRPMSEIFGAAHTNLPVRIQSVWD